MNAEEDGGGENSENEDEGDAEGSGERWTDG